MPTIEVPNFWIFRLPCSCPYGSVLAVQPGLVIPTPEQAWDHFYVGEKRKGERDRKSGCTVVGVETFDVERWTAGHEHPDCTREV